MRPNAQFPAEESLGGKGMKFFARKGGINLKSVCVCVGGGGV